MSELPALAARLEDDYGLRYYWTKGGVRRPELVYRGCDILDDRDYGNAVLSRFPIIEDATTGSFPYTDEEPGERRGYMHTKINVNGAVVDVFNTHIGLRTYSPNRSTSSKT